MYVKRLTQFTSLYQSHFKLGRVQVGFYWLVSQLLKVQEVLMPVDITLVGSLKSAMKVQIRPFLPPGELVVKHLRAHY